MFPTEKNYLFVTSLSANNCTKWFMNSKPFLLQSNKTLRRNLQIALQSRMGSGGQQIQKQTALTRTRAMALAVMILVLAATALIVALDPHADLMAWTASIERYRTVDNLIYVSILYVICLAVPFMPGVEIGLLLMLIFGKTGIIAAYLGTIVGLNLSFAVGRLLDRGKFGEFLHRRYASTRYNSDAWFQTTIDRSPVVRPILHFFEHRFQNLRYFSVGVLFNLPGNSVVGGGGGIALICGMTSAFSWFKFAITVAVATLFVPLLVFLGVVNIEVLMNV